MARPTKYKDEFVKAAEDYLDECRANKRVPWLEELAARLDVTEQTIWNWTKEREEFFDAVDKIKDHQRMALKTLGLKSPHVITFLLEANHGMMRTEKRQIETPDGEGLTLIFTDSETFKRHKANKARLEAQNNKSTANNKVYNGEGSEQVGGFNWDNYINKTS